MARNSEKAMSMLNRWLAMKRGFIVGHRPTDAKSCSKLSDCERWRRQVVKQVVRKVAVIQNASLGEPRIRDLNEEINKLVREKNKWEQRIIELNGPDYRTKADLVDDDGESVPIIDGFYYFGAAKLLPSVKELLQKRKYGKKESIVDNKKMKERVDVEYFGFVSDESHLLESERKNEKRERESLNKETIVERQRMIETQGFNDDDLIMDLSSLPCEEDIRNLLLEKRKQDVISKYITPETSGL